jgi:hypothetical protein
VKFRLLPPKVILVFLGGVRLKAMTVFSVSAMALKRIVAKVKAPEGKLYVLPAA